MPEPVAPSNGKGVAPKRCAGRTGAGEPCGTPAHLLRWNEDEAAWLCFTHDPAMADERQLAREKGGMRQIGKLRRFTFLDKDELGRLETPLDAKRWAAQLAVAVATGRLTAGAASVVRNLLEQFVRSHEALDLERRIAELEARVAARDDEAERQKRQRARERAGPSEYFTREKR